MQWSRYNTLFRSDLGRFCYSSLSNTLLELDEIHYALLEACQRGHELYDRLARDASLREKLKELGDRERLATYVKDELGYVFTKEEMRKVVFERNPEMTDEDLQAVVGGMIFGTGINDVQQLAVIAMGL